MSNDPLIVNLKQVPDEGFHLEEEIDQEILGLADVEVHVRGPLSLKADIFPIQQGARARGTIEGVYSQECVRCLDPVEQLFSIEFTGLFQSAGGHREKQEQDVRHQEEDEAFENGEPYPIVNNQIDLGEMLREYVILGVPLHPLCQTNCQGLCPICGINLNKGTCFCNREGKISPFSVLRTVLDQSKKKSAKKMGKR